MGLTQEEATQSLRNRLSKDSRFKVLSEDERPGPNSSPVRLSLSADLDLDQGSELEVQLVARKRQGDESVRLNATATRALAQTVESPSGALHEAFERALADVVEQTALQLTALNARDPVLLKQLDAQDPRMREAALRVLTLRKNPRAFPVWLKRLEGDDPLAVREAIGVLVELHDPRATPALIELGRKKESGFLREIIFALEIIGGEEAKGYLYTLAQGHDEPRVREAALSAWETLERQGKGSQ